jgi:TPR repeat protein
MELKQLTKKANKGSKDHQFMLGMRYLKGKDIMQDVHQAEKWLKKACKKNHPEALYQMGLIKIDQEAYKLAFTYTLKACKHKFFSAYKLLGTFYRGDYDETLKDIKKAQEAFYAYYKHDKYEGLEPLLSVYDYNTFKSSKKSYQFLKESMEFGLIKAKFHLAILFLNDKKYLNYDQALAYLESYYEATADVNAARELYYLYSPKETVYKHFKHKDEEKARLYLRDTITKDGVLAGTEFISTKGVYYPEHYYGANSYLEKQLLRMKTSLAIDQSFSQIVSLNTFDITMHYNVETVYDYQAKIKYKKKITEEEIIEKTIEKKQTVKKGLKKTGTVKIPTTVKETKKHKKWVEEETDFNETGRIEQVTTSHHQALSLKELAETLESTDYVFDITEPNDAKTLEKAIHKEIKKAFKKPKKSKKIKREMTFDYIYKVEPVLEITYTFKHKTYHDIINLSDKENTKGLSFPLEKSFEKELKRFMRKQNSLDMSNWILSILWYAGFFVTFLSIYPIFFSGVGFIKTLHDYFIYQALSAGISFLIAYFIHKIIKVNPITKDEYITHYDDATADELAKDVFKNMSKLYMKFGVVLILTLINLYIYYLM